MKVKMEYVTCVYWAEGWSGAVIDGWVDEMKDYNFSNKDFCFNVNIVVRKLFLKRILLY